MSQENERLLRRIERERAARKEAERLLEERSLELYRSNCALTSLADNLEKEVEKRTQELQAVTAQLRHALADAEQANTQLRLTQKALERQLFAVDQHTIASITDRAGTILYANDKFVAISGHTREELIGSNHRIINSGYHPPEFFAGLWQTIAAGQVWSGEIRNRRKDGSHYWVHATIVPFLDEAGLPYQYFSIRTDISALKQAEEALRQKIHALGERVKEWSCLNAVTQTLLQDELADDVILAAAVRIIPSGWQSPRHTCARIRIGAQCHESPGFVETGTRLATRIALADEDAWVEVCLRDGDDRPGFLPEEQILLDSLANQIAQVMARRRAQRELIASRDAAEAASRAKSNFLANMSHEIRTPMNGILGMTDLALDTDSETERREYLEIVRKSARSLLGILNDILDLSKIEAGKLEIERLEFDPRELVNDSLRTLEARAREKGLELSSEFATGLPDRLAGDPTRLRQILLNLIGNGIKFTERGRVEVGVEVVAASGQALSVAFTVRDSGIGIATDKLATIFEAFSQADTSTTRKYGGTGLGLTITQRLVERMGGYLEVESRPGQGSRFRFILPMGRVVGPAPAANAPPRPAVAAGMPGGVAHTVLLVEDNPVNQRLAIRLLEKWGHRVTLAANGEEAVARVATGERYDLVLMDVQMPVLGGLEATRRIRTLETERGLAPLRIIAMTANAMHGDREACLDAGMDDYIAKPIVQAELAARLGALHQTTPPAGASAGTPGDTARSPGPA